MGRTTEIYKPGVGVVSPVLMRLAQTIYPGGNMHAIPKYIVVLDDNVAEIDADTELDASVLGGVRVPIRHSLLERDGTPHGINDAGELGKQPVPRRLDHPPSVLGDTGLD